MAVIAGDGMTATDRTRRVVVTGAGTGIGRAIALRLARAGHTVVGTARAPSRAAELSGDARAAGLPLEYRPLDLSSRNQVEALAASLAEGGGIDVLVNNAGYGIFGAVEDVQPEQVLRQFDVNLFGPLLLTRLLMPGLRERQGRIVWVGSLAGRQSLAFQGHYSATKAATAAVSDALRMELKPFGVHVTCVEPGDISTEFTSSRIVLGGEESAYAARAARSLAAVEREEHHGPSPECVARAVERVLARRRPPARVPAGSLGRTTALFLRLAPYDVAQWVVARLYRF